MKGTASYVDCRKLFLRMIEEYKAKIADAIVISSIYLEESPTNTGGTVYMYIFIAALLLIMFDIEHYSFSKTLIITVAPISLNSA